MRIIQIVTIGISLFMRYIAVGMYHSAKNR
jgi:hypothetical protein